MYSTYYDIHYPNEERQAGRPLRTSPAYEQLQALGAVFGEKSGWERPNWFTSNEANGDASLRPHGWAGRHWSSAIGVEAQAAKSSELPIVAIAIARAGRLVARKGMRDMGTLLDRRLEAPARSGVLRVSEGGYLRRSFASVR